MRLETLLRTKRIEGEDGNGLRDGVEGAGCRDSSRIAVRVRGPPRDNSNLLIYMYLDFRIVVRTS